MNSFNLYLLNKLSIKNIILGADFKFGKDRKGDLFLLKEKAQEVSIQCVSD